MVLLVGCVLFASLPLTASGAENSRPGTVANNSATSPSTIVIGFVGGFVHRDDMRHTEIQLAKKLGARYSDRVRVEIFRNRQRESARQAIHRWLDRDEDGDLSSSERQQARIILYGHSWGASAAVMLARELQQEQIPVLLTIQVDSVAKLGQNDAIIPPNVGKAVNFYQTRGLLRGRTSISAADPERTTILGDFRFDYPRMPAECSAYPWFDRHLFKGHTSIECDPQVWNRVEDLIDSYLSVQAAPTPTAVALTQ